jgi:endogenous inhibitor of DNA gyrase (YacG/DUF329 family)
MICPTCKRTFDHPSERPKDSGRPHFGPFCSERCRSADLGNWLDGNYRIANSADADEDDDGLAAAVRSDDSSGDAVN